MDKEAIKEAIINDLRRVAEKLQSPYLSRSTFAKEGRIGATKVADTFGSWNEAIVAAGLKPLPQGGFPRTEWKVENRLLASSSTSTVPPPVSDAELLQDLVRLQEELGRRPSVSQVNAKGNYSANLYKKRWGSVAAAAEAAAHPLSKQV